MKKAFKFIFYGLRYPLLVADVVTMFIWSLCNVLNDRLLSGIASGVVSGESLPPKIITYALLLLFWIIDEWIVDILTDVCAEDTELSARRYYVDRMYRCKPEILRKFNTGYISGLVNKLTYARADVLHLLTEQIPIGIVYIVATCIILITSYHWIYALVIIVTATLAILFRIEFNKLNKKNISELSDAEAEDVQLFLDAGTNVNTVQKLQAIDFIMTKFAAGTLRCRKAIVRYSEGNERAFVGFKGITYTIFPVCALIQITHPETVGDIAGFYAFLALIQIRVLHMIKGFSNLVKYWAKYKTPYDKLEDILCENNIRQGLNQSDFETAEIKDCDYSYVYEDRDNKELKKTVRIQIPYFQINKGDIVCIHGESGQGKTTLLNILSGEIETDNVYINGVQTAKRLDCVFIAQDTEIFDMTIADNLSLGNKEVTEDQLYKMFEAAGMKDWIDSQPDKFNTRLGERGVFVSTGQRQRLNLIRGLVIPYGEIYFFDEPTSNVDDETEDRMIELIKKKLEGKTAIIVTHKPKIRKICNRSYLFEKGILSEE